MNVDKMRGKLFILLFLQFMTGFCSESEVTPSEAAGDTTDHSEDHLWEQVSQFQDTDLDDSTLLRNSKETWALSLSMLASLQVFG